MAIYGFDLWLFVGWWCLGQNPGHYTCKASGLIHNFITSTIPNLIWGVHHGVSQVMIEGPRVILIVLGQQDQCFYVGVRQCVAAHEIGDHQDHDFGRGI